jgi:hypothetical protein
MLARAVYHMLQGGVACDLKTFLQSEGREVGEPAAELGHYRVSLTTVLGKEAPPASANAHEHIGTCPDPVRLIGRLLPLLSIERTSLRVTVGCPSPEPEPHWRTQTCSLAFA